VTSLALLAPVLAPLKALDGVWLVGGAPRDALLDRPLKDIDLAVAGDPRRAAELMGRALKARAFPLDEERGIYRVVQPDGARVFDFTKIEGLSIETDLRRRDFTINALALPLSSLGVKNPAFIDLFDGRADLKRRRVRLTGEKALKDDPLRVLRAFRFAAELGFSIDPRTAAAAARHRKLLTRCAAERLRDELLKILATPRSAAVFRAMDKAKVLSVLFPEAEPMRRAAHAYYGKQGVLGHSLDAMASFDKLTGEWEKYFPKYAGKIRLHLDEKVGGHRRLAFLKLAEFLHDVGKPATAKTENGKLHFYGHDHVGRDMSLGIGQRLRLSQDETRSVARLVGGHMRAGNLGHQPVLTDRAVFRFYRDLENDAVGMLLVSLADHFTYLSERQKKSGKDPVFRAIETMLARHFLTPERVHPPRLVTGNDLMKTLRLKEGPAVGRLLIAIQEAQGARRVKSREEALRFAQKLLKSLNQ